jgi:hypothetical protein
MPLTTSNLLPIASPGALPECTPQQILFGPPVEPLERIKGYSPEKFEDFICEWAFYYVQEILKQYQQISHFGGAGDKGRDIVAYIDLASKACDIFQCKHYDHPLSPSDVWLELAKLCYYTHIKTIPIPRRYRFVAPQDVSAATGLLLEAPNDLRSGLIEVWQAATKEPLSKKLVKGTSILLDGDLLKHVNAFDFTIIGYKPILEVVAEHRKTTRFAPRFGGGLTKPLPSTPVPPTQLAAHETTYTSKLIDAYRDNLKDPAFDFDNLPAQVPFHRHFNRSRERFYCAETLREFARDALPEGTTFKAVQDQVFDRVVDVVEATHPCGYTRLVAVTNIAGGMQVTNHPLGVYLQTKSLQGICHQLANDDRITWVNDD